MRRSGQLNKMHRMYSKNPQVTLNLLREAHKNILKNLSEFHDTDLPDKGVPSLSDSLQ
jgi:hypothetical protein